MSRTDLGNNKLRPIRPLNAKHDNSSFLERNHSRTVPNIKHNRFIHLDKMNNNISLIRGLSTRRNSFPISNVMQNPNIGRLLVPLPSLLIPPRGFARVQNDGILTIQTRRGMLAPIPPKMPHISRSDEKKVNEKGKRSMLPMIDSQELQSLMVQRPVIIYMQQRKPKNIY